MTIIHYSTPSKSIFHLCSMSNICTIQQPIRMPILTQVALTVLIGLVANLTAVFVLATRYRTSFQLGTSARKIKRGMRWVVSVAGLVIASMLGLTLLQIFVLGLLTVTAATDFEHQRLPPSWFLYTATIIGVIAATFTAGWIGLRNAVIAQAIWFALMTLTVMLLRRTAGGDIKVVMQYGAACGNLPISILGMLIASGIMLPISLGYWLIYHRSIQRTPLAPLTWIGAIIALILAKSYGTSFF